MLVTLSGMVTEVSETQFMKALSSIIVPVRPGRMVTDPREVQRWKASAPMLVTLPGIVTEVREVQPEKAELPMLVTPFGMVTVVSLLQL